MPESGRPISRDDDRSLRAGERRKRLFQQRDLRSWAEGWHGREAAFGRPGGIVDLELVEEDLTLHAAQLHVNRPRPRRSSPHERH